MCTLYVSYVDVLVETQKWNGFAPIKWGTILEQMNDGSKTMKLKQSRRFRKINEQFRTSDKTSKPQRKVQEIVIATHRKIGLFLPRTFGRISYDVHTQFNGSMFRISTRCVFLLLCFFSPVCAVLSVCHKTIQKQKTNDTMFLDFFRRRART